MLQGKSVIVTGAGRGLGQAYAIHAARAGAAVVVNDIDVEHAAGTAAEITAAGGTAVVSGHDVADPAAAEALVEFCLDRLGALDGLVNNAALNHEAWPWEEDAARTRRMIEVNVLGVIQTGVAAIRAMPAGGCIVNISSGASLGQRRLGAYAATKGAVASLTYSWALDLEDVGIRVNAVCPFARTRMVAASERATRNCPPDCTPELVAPLVVFLLSDHAAGITGQMIRCTGHRLHIIGQPHLKEPILQRQEWDTDSVRRAFAEVFTGHLEPYGLEKRVPPPMRTWFAPV